MSNDFIPFDDIRSRVKEALGSAPMPESAPPVYLVRDLFGMVRISVSEDAEDDADCRKALQQLADRLKEQLGPRGYPPENAVLFVSQALLNTLKDTARKIHQGVYLCDRLVTGSGWWTVGDVGMDKSAKHFTLFSVKGGVGRSTTAAVLAWHLARRGERALVVDLDLESPGLSSAMIGKERRPAFGVTDWFVEDLVGQGDPVVEGMLAAPAWAQDLEGDVRVAPAHGADPGEYLAKLGRVYMDAGGETWIVRLKRLLDALEAAFDPTVVLLESRSGLHDIAAATVTDLDAEVLLFAVDADSNWTDYDILFRHWLDQGLATRIRERLSIVSALTPELDTNTYLQGFREKAWNLFRGHLYDELEPSAETGDEFSFALDDEHAPHFPTAVHWTRGLAAGSSLRHLERTTVEQAYTQFLRWFEQLAEIGNGGDG